MRITRNPGVLESQLDDELVLLNVQTGRYYGLNRVGRFVWQTLGESHTLDEVIAAVMDTHDVTLDRATADVQALVRRLAQEGLVTMSDA